MREITLALSGGATRGAYQLGVLHFIEQENIKVNAICGTSIGAIIGASWLSGVRAKEQLEIYKSKEFKKIFSFNYFRSSFFTIDTEAKILDMIVPKKNIQDLPTPFFVTAVDLVSGNNIHFDSGDIKKLCFAASALVPIFPPVHYEAYKLVDGGFIDHIPMEPLRVFDGELVAVNLHPIYKKEIGNGILQNFMRSLTISTYKESIDLKNSCDIYITSKKLLDYNMFSFRELDSMFLLGYEDAKDKLGLKL
jgi:NTE family protein